MHVHIHSRVDHSSVHIVHVLVYMYVINVHACTCTCILFLLLVALVCMINSSLCPQRVMVSVGQLGVTGCVRGVN